MSHSLPLITTLAIALGLALILGFIAVRLKLPIVVGYLVTGIFIGTHTPGFVANAEIARELAEIGVMLLMFGVGLHFSLNDLIAVRKIALPGAILQILVATALGTWVASSWGWALGGALVFGLALSVASTAVLLRALESHNLLESLSGRIAVGWLVVEDLATILVIVLLPPLSLWLQSRTQGITETHLWQTLGLTILQVSAFITLMVVAGRKIFPKILWQITRTGSRELFTLCIVAGAITVAYLASTLFGVSFALGAFFAGMMMSESPLSHRAAEESLPLREAFSVLFFVSVGMLFDPLVLIHQPLEVLAVLGIIMLGKTAAAAALVLFFRYPLNTALLVSASLAQIGEFSFILASLGVSLNLLPLEGQSLILAGALISIALNPLLFKVIIPLEAWASSRPYLNKLFDRSHDPLTALPTKTKQKYLSGQVVLVGYGRVGSRIGKILFKNGVPFIVAEQDRELVEELRLKKIVAIFSYTDEPQLLLQAHVARASMLIIAIPDTFGIRQIIRQARIVNSKIEILVRVHNDEEASLLQEEKGVRVFYSENELAKSIGAYVLKRYGIERK